MKKKLFANIVMVAIIAVIAAAGVLGVGHIRGWFDTADSTQAVLRDMRGVIRLERDGVSYTAEGGTVLRTGDKITCDPGATTVIQIGSSTLALGEKAEVLIVQSSAEGFKAEVTAGEVFANCENSAVLSFAGKEVTFSKVTAFLSIRTGAQSVSVLRGSVENASAGQVLNYIGDDLSVSSFDINSLNDFAIAQIRSVTGSYALCVTEEDLDQLEADRQIAMQEIIDSQTNRPAPEPDPTDPTEATTLPAETDSTEPQTQATDPSGSDKPDPSIQSTTPPETEGTEPTEAVTAPAETVPEETTSPETAAPDTYSCTITIRCDTILNNMSDLDPSKAGYIPSNGVILPTVSVSFTEGETVFDVLKRVCAASGIQLEYSWQAIFDTYYIEGIHNLYEKDCGSESGWMYQVNGWFPNYGISGYRLKDGDAIAFLYTCKGYGTDVGAPE